MNDVDCSITRYETHFPDEVSAVVVCNWLMNIPNYLLLDQELAYFKVSIINPSSRKHLEVDKESTVVWFQQTSCLRNFILLEISHLRKLRVSLSKFLR